MLEESHKKIATSVEPEEELIPARGRIPWRAVPFWLAATGGLLVLFIAVGVYSERLYESIDLVGLLKAPISTFQRNLFGALAYRSLAVFIPWLGALATLWIAFARPGWSDRYLWSAAMVFTAMELATDAGQLFSRHGPSGTEHLYPNPLMVTGLIAYSSWLLIAAREGQPSPAKRVAEVLFVVALLFIIAFPLLAGYIRSVDIIGSILFAGACFSAGVFVAQLCGVDLFKRNDASAG